MKLKDMVWGAVIAAAGVIVAGYVLYWGQKNDVPFIKDAHGGFDS